MKRTEQQYVVSSWLTAQLSRAKRIPSLRNLLSRNKARKLSPEEAQAQKERHAKLVNRLAPDAKATEADLKAFIAKEEAKLDNGRRVFVPERTG